MKATHCDDCHETLAYLKKRAIEADRKERKKDRANKEDISHADMTIMVSVIGLVVMGVSYLILYSLGWV